MRKILAFAFRYWADVLDPPPPPTGDAWWGVPVDFTGDGTVTYTPDSTTVLFK